jgi:hypothetical protein
MLKRITNRKAQNTAEYAILIALVIGAVIAMQTYMQRAIGARVLDTSKFMSETSSDVTGKAYQYEPYYQNTQYKIDKTTGEDDVEFGTTINLVSGTTTNKSGFDAASFDRTAVGLSDYGNAL